MNRWMGEGEGRRKEKVGKVVGEREGVRGEGKETGGMREGWGGGGGKEDEREAEDLCGIHGNIIDGDYRRKGIKDMSG